MLTGKFIWQRIGWRRKEQPLVCAIYSAHLIWGKRYPAWRDAFFDRHFLRIHVIPLLVERHGDLSMVQPETFAQKWVQQFAIEECYRQRLVAELTPAVADFLSFVEAERRYFISEAERRQAKLRKLWAWLPLHNTLWTLTTRLAHTRSHAVTGCK